MKARTDSRRLSVFVIAVVLVTCRMAFADRTSWRFDFGGGGVEQGYTGVAPETAYDAERGYGFDRDSHITAAQRPGGDLLRSDYCTSDKPFFFSVAVPEGNYRVILTLGDAAEHTMTTVKSESRRLMLEGVAAPPGQYLTRSFLVNVHTPQISSSRSVRRKPREIGMLRWDDKLTLEFSGSHPAVCGVEIEAADSTMTVYLAGDSTVTDQAEAAWCGWGQMLPRFFRPDRVVVSNHAESGETLSSFVGERRLEKLWTTFHAGDYLFIQFGHNDMKQIGPDAGAFKNYTRLLKQFVADARARDGQPVLVTPMHRLSFNSDGKIENSLGDYPDAMRQVARDEHVPLIDLNAMSKEFYETLGPADAQRAFVDQTHSNEYGANEFARFIAEQVKHSDLGLAQEVVDDLPPPNTTDLPGPER